MKFKIMSIINEWDPIDLFPMAPINEYDSEIEKILFFLKSKKNITISQLQLEINKIFISSFGNDIYKSSLEECKTIAIKILNEIYK